MGSLRTEPAASATLPEPTLLTAAAAAVRRAVRVGAWAASGVSGRKKLVKHIFTEMKKQATLRDEAEAFELGPVDHLKVIHTFLKNKKYLSAKKQKEAEAAATGED